MSINPAPLATESRPFATSAASLDPRPPTAASAEANGGDTAFWGEDGFDFGDLLDLINPLQHLPIISTLYREITGDTIAPGPRLLGGAAFGGPLGMASAMVNLAIEDTTGRDIGANALALFDRAPPASKVVAPEVVAIATTETAPLQAPVLAQTQAPLLAQTEASAPARGAAAGSESRSFGAPTTPSIDDPRRLTPAEIAEFVARYERSLLKARTLYESEEGQP